MSAVDNAVWGPPLWKLLHDELYKYPDTPTEQDKFNMSENIRYTIFSQIKCFDCLQHALYYFTSSMSSKSMFDSKLQLCGWGFNFHNWVNNMLGKPPFSVLEFMKLYPLKGFETLFPRQTF